MPTARELLEQADALMRRNRPGALPGEAERRAAASVARAAADAPRGDARVEPRLDVEAPIASTPPPSTSSPTTAAVNAPPGDAGGAHAPAPDAAPPEAAPPDAVPAHAPPDATRDEEEAVSPPPVAQLLRAASFAEQEDDFPVLTEAVPPPAPGGAVADASDGDTAARVASPTDLEDVPLLTDAVEEIEAPSILDLADDDASIWRETLTGTRTEQPVVAAAAPAPTVESIDIAAPPFAGVYDLPTRALEPHAYAEPTPAGHEAEPGLPIHSVEPEQPVDERAEEQPGHLLEPAGQEAHAQPPLGEPSMTQPGDGPAIGAAGAAASTPAVDDARWHEMAEEIRMQVLQRIDLFTDTGLRDQLAERLKPIVDRASADLVATINQHVGVILRAYVAEAIEREIERWRGQGR